MSRNDVRRWRASTDLATGGMRWPSVARGRLRALPLVVGIAIVASVPAAAQAVTIDEFATPTNSNAPALKGTGASVPSATYGIARGPGQSVWFTENLANKVGRVAADGTVKEFAIPTERSGAVRIAPAAKGDGMWFAEYAADKIAHVDANGGITEHELAGDAAPYGVAVDDDGDVWFTASHANRIGRLSPSGRLTEFAVPTANAVPWDITKGADGAMWFSEYGANKIGRIDAAGRVTEHPIPTANSVPSGVAAAEDGTIWFTENAGDKIGRVDAAGRIAEFPIPLKDDNIIGTSAPTDIAPGPDGAMWFAEPGSNAVGRITAGGDVTHYAVPTDDNGSQVIEPGHGNTLWFTEVNRSRIGRNEVDPAPKAKQQPPATTGPAAPAAGACRKGLTTAPFPNSVSALLGC
jgi:virginiamycin B lyase